MFKIGEFSQINRVTIKTLRLYDKIGLFIPKIVDRESGYRYYDNSQLIGFQRILSLKQMGLSLTEIKELISTNLSDMEFKKRVVRRITEIESNIENQNSQLQKLKNYINEYQSYTKMESHVIIKDLPEVTVASMRKVIPNYSEFNSFFPEMGKLMEKAKVECYVPEYCFSIYHDGEYKEKDIDVEICQAVKKAGENLGGMTFKVIKKVPIAACILHKGSYSTIGKSYSVLFRWIEENGYKIADHPRESYIDGIWNKENPEDWLTEIQTPIIKK